MNKMIRWALATAAILTISESAMALDTSCAYDATIVNNNAQPVFVGVVRFAFDQLISTPWADACAFAGRWINYAGLPLSTNVFVEEEATFSNGDCLENSVSPQISVIHLASPANPNFNRSFGFDKFQQKHQICNLVLAGDLGANFNGIIQTSCSAIPYGFNLMRRP
jgi:hypothetical protein